MKTCIKLLTPRDRLSPEHVTSPLKKKSKTTFGSSVNDSKKDKEQTYSNEIGSKGGKKLEAIATQGSIKGDLKPKLDHVIDNIQVELIVFAKLVVSITKLVIINTKSFQPIQLEVEPIQIENP